MTHVTCRLTAKNRDQLRNPTLGTRVWATFFTSDGCLDVKKENIQSCCMLYCKRICIPHLCTNVHTHTHTQVWVVLKSVLRPHLAFFLCVYFEWMNEYLYSQQQVYVFCVSLGDFVCVLFNSIVLMCFYFLQYHAKRLPEKNLSLFSQS